MTTTAPPLLAGIERGIAEARYESRLAYAQAQLAWDRGRRTAHQCLRGALEQIAHAEGRLAVCVEQELRAERLSFLRHYVTEELRRHAGR